jgi:23S rRNA (adenine2503-C2)-methyltransferase
MDAGAEMMRILKRTGSPELAQVFLGQLRGHPRYTVEFVDACGERGGDRRRKWVIIVSSQFGCPVDCLMCDAGGGYHGDLTAEEMLWQMETVLANHPEVDPRSCAKLKVQFARMGEPSLNDQVLSAIGRLGKQYPDCIPCVATVAPAGREEWFAGLLDLRNLFRDFQLQFSINSTDEEYRDLLMPIEKQPWEWLAEFGQAFHQPGQRRAVLNFALSDSVPVDAAAAARWFDPQYFVVKLTPLNPTAAGQANELIIPQAEAEGRQLVDLRAAEFAAQGFDVIRSVGEWEENRIGSNCGQLARPLAREIGW